MSTPWWHLWHLCWTSSALQLSFVPGCLASQSGSPFSLLGESVDSRCLYNNPFPGWNDHSWLLLLTIKNLDWDRDFEIDNLMKTCKKNYMAEDVWFYNFFEMTFVWWGILKCYKFLPLSFRSLVNWRILKLSEWRIRLDLPSLRTVAGDVGCGGDKDPSKLRVLFMDHHP